MTSRTLARLQPLGQERVRIDLRLAVVAHAGIVEPALDGAAAPGVEQVRAAADVLTGEKKEGKALLRRASADRAHAPLSAGRVTLDLEGYTVRIGDGAAISLTKLELRLMQMLLAQAGRAVNSDRLLVQVWGHRGSGDRQLLKQLVHRLRHKIEVNPAVPQVLQTAAPSGYKLIVD